MADNGYAVTLDQPMFDGFLNDDTDDFNPIIRIDSSEIIYEPEKPSVSFIGNRYLKGAQVGEGSYSKVKEVLDIETLCRRAIKIVKTRKIRRIPNGHANVIREIQLLKKLKHKNVIKLIENFQSEEKQKLYIVLEFCCCNLQQMLENASDKRFPEWQAHFYFAQIIEGLHYLHSKGVIHKDIKPGNLLLTVDQTLKISDLGVSEELNAFATNDRIKTSQGSPAFQPPEIANGDEHFLGFKVDVWSTGVTLFNMMTGSYPFEGDNIYRLFENIAKGDFTIPSMLDKNLQELIKGMLIANCEDRFSIKDIQDHIWFKRQIPQSEPAVPMISDPKDPYIGMSTIPHLQCWITQSEEPYGFEDDGEIIESSTTYNLNHNASQGYTSEEIFKQNEGSPISKAAAAKSADNNSRQKSKAKNCHIC